jgi:hypothetical protein
VKDAKLPHIKPAHTYITPDEALMKYLTKEELDVLESSSKGLDFFFIYPEFKKMVTLFKDLDLEVL